MTENIEVLTHSSIRITGKETIYIDPYRISEETHDADIILITHDHFDHFSPEDIEKIIKQNTKFVVPEKMGKKIASVSRSPENVAVVKPGMKLEVGSITVETVAAYNNLKPFHPKKDGWVGYLLTVNHVVIYIAGDTDITKENKSVACDVALVPIGGTYTMNAKEAAELVNSIRPKAAIPIHYGSVAGTKAEEDVFRKSVDSSIPVEIKMQKY